MQEINLLVEQKDGSIETNFEEIKAALAAGLEEYKGMVFTAESQPEAKRTVASLRKLKKAMNDRRIEIKKKFDGIVYKRRITAATASYLL